MVEREESASLTEESLERRSWWRERTSERSCFSRRRIPSWRFSARAAEEPEERAAEEKRVESKSGERNAEKMGSEGKESSGEGGEVAVVGVVIMKDDDGVAAAAVVLLSLKVERR